MYIACKTAAVLLIETIRVMDKQEHLLLIDDKDGHSATPMIWSRWLAVGLLTGHSCSQCSGCIAKLHRRQTGSAVAAAAIL